MVLETLEKVNATTVCLTDQIGGYSEVLTKKLNYKSKFIIVFHMIITTFV